MQVPIFDFIGSFFAPVILAAENKHHLEKLIKAAGWEVTLTEPQADAVNSVLGVINVIEDLTKLAEDIKEEDVSAGSATEQAIILSEALYNAVRDLKNIDVNAIATLPNPLNEKNWWTEFAESLFNYLLFRWLRLYPAYIYESLYFLGIISETNRGDGLYPDAEIHWDKLGEFFSNPTNYLQNEYQWGNSFENVRFIKNLNRLMNSVSLQTNLLPVGQHIQDTFYSGNAVPSDASEMDLILLSRDIRNTGITFEPHLRLSPIPHPSNANKNGLYLYSSLAGNLPTELSLNENWVLDYSNFKDALEQSIGIQIQNNGLQFGLPFDLLETKLEFKGQPEEPWVLFGDPLSTRLELGGIYSSLGIKSVGSDPDIEFTAKTTGPKNNPDEQGIKFIINPGEGDSFISKVLGDKELAITADAGFTWSSQNGFTFEGGAGFELLIPVDKSLGPIQLELIRLALAGGTDGVQFEAAITGGLNISALSVVVDDIGLRAKLVPAEDGDGMLGPMDVTLGLKPPSGLGLSLDAANIVKGGGYIEHDEEKAQYAGVAEIKFTKLGLSAIGILTTRMPDGSDGWSLFLSIFSTFPPIQLGFGFTLNGVGGLVGINRTLDEEALRQRLLTGAMDSIMFPEDPVANAPRIINDIEAIFPPAQDQFIFGAMFNLGWGGGTSLITVNLGVLVELPDPIRIAILGQLKALFPNKDLPIVEMNIDVFGLIDITNGTLSIDGVLRDSCIRLDPTKDEGMITLSGDMAMRAEFQGKPSMLLSVGGFHPKFTPPDRFPTLRRMQVSMPNIPGVGLEFSSYLAITPNTFQIGGRLDVWARFSGFSAEGYIEFDVLIQFQPFGFDFHTAFGVSVRAGRITLMGVDVSTDIKGPGKWEINGYARFEILKVKKKINLEITMGKKKPNPAETYNVSQLVYDALADIGNWNIIEDSELAGFVRLTEASQDNTELLNPKGAVQAIQKIAPLNTEIEEFSSGKISGAKKYEIEKVFIGSTQVTPQSDQFIEEWFSPASFFKMNDKEKLAAPSFEEMDGGINLTSSNTYAGESEEITIKHEEICIDRTLNQRRKFKKLQQSLEKKELYKLSKQGPKAKLFRENTQILNKLKTPQYEINKSGFKGIDIDNGKELSINKTKRPVTFAEAQFAMKQKNMSSFSNTKRYEVKAQ